MKGPITLKINTNLKHLNFTVSKTGSAHITIITMWSHIMSKLTKLHFMVEKASKNTRCCGQTQSPPRSAADSDDSPNVHHL